MLKELKELTCLDFLANVFFTRAKIADKLELLLVFAPPSVAQVNFHCYYQFRYAAKRCGDTPVTRAVFAVVVQVMR